MPETETQGKPKIEKHKKTPFAEFNEKTAKFIADKILPDWDYERPGEFSYRVFRLRKTSEDGARLTLQINTELNAIRFTKHTEFDVIDLVFPAQKFIQGDAGLVFEDSVSKRKLTIYGRLYRITSTGEEKPPLSEEIYFD